MIRSVFPALLQLRRQREQAAHSALANRRRQMNDARSALDEARAEFERHLINCREREDTFRRKVTGKRIRSLTMELFRLDLESMAVRTELLENRVDNRKASVDQAEQALREAIAAWQRCRRDLERIEQLSARERQAQRRAQERLAEDRLEELSAMTARPVGEQIS
ncbi:MAG: YscO family type III secretion system apparatus protein [Geminicoccaceae bacterium]